MNKLVPHPIAGGTTHSNNSYRTVFTQHPRFIELDSLFLLEQQCVKS